VEQRNSYKSWRREFHLNFPHTTCPPGDTISKLVKKVRTHGILTEMPLKLNRVLTVVIIYDNGGLENSP
jgi:hypothetical protein